MEIWSENQFKEIWIYLDDGQSMCALINGDFGWLMYLREEGDVGLSSRNPNYAGSGDETMDFTLSNGQVDEYPLAWVLPVEIVNKALVYFENSRKLPDFITWHDDTAG